MTDVIALLAISQLVCLGGLAYLYTQVKALQRPRRHAARPSTAATSVREPRASAPDALALATAAATSRAAARAYRSPAPTTRTAAGAASRGPRGASDLAELATKLLASGLDVPALASRLGRSEEEVRLLLRRHGVVR